MSKRSALSFNTLTYTILIDRDPSTDKQVGLKELIVVAVMKKDAK